MSGAVHFVQVEIRPALRLALEHKIGIQVTIGCWALAISSIKLSTRAFSSALGSLVSAHDAIRAVCKRPNR